MRGGSKALQSRILKQKKKQIEADDRGIKFNKVSSFNLAHPPTLQEYLDANDKEGVGLGYSETIVKLQQSKSVSRLKKKFDYI